LRRPILIGNRREGGLWWKLPLATLLWLLVAAPIVAGLFALSVLRHHAEGLPFAPNLNTWQAKAPRSTTILAADRSVLAQLPFHVEGQSGHRMLVSYDEIPPLVIRAILAAEDLRFFAHEGIDTKAVVRSAWANYRAKRIVQGASTITQQLARNLVKDIGKERSLRRKIREALLARRIEAHHDKKEIFSAYANYVFLGANAYGVAAAARAYFSKPLSKLNIAEAALIAGLIQIPGRGNAYQRPEVARERRNVILERMLRAGFIEEAEYGQAVASDLTLTPPPEHYGSIAPWATEHARQWTEKEMPGSFALGGLEVETSVLPVLSAQSEKIASERAIAMENEEEESAQVGVLLFDHQSGYVEVMAGGTNWQKNKFNRATQSCRQPGSAFKPIVYGAALDAQVITPATPLRDGPISEYDPKLQVYWKPTNSGREFRGIAIAQDAIASSLNTPAVDVYDRVGGSHVIAFAKRMGISTPLRDLRPLALGASCVLPLELARAYATVARGGLWIEPTVITSVIERGHRVVDNSSYFDPNLSGKRRLDRISFAASTKPTRVLDEGIAYQLRSMLRAVVTGGTATAARRLPMPVAGKTGTTNNNTDAWFVGFGSRSTAAVWLGHDDPKQALGRGRDGGRAALPLWKEIVKLAEESRPPGEVPGPAPDSLQPHRIDRDSGLLAAPKAGGALELYFKAGTAPTEVAGAAAATRDFARQSGSF
jgi:penicillin-binding protein 1A